MSVDLEKDNAAISTEVIDMTSKPLTTAQVEEFRERGFLKVGKVVDDKRCSAMLERLHDVMDGRSSVEPEAKRNLLEGEERVVIQVVNIWMADDLFREHLYYPT